MNQKVGVLPWLPVSAVLIFALVACNREPAATACEPTPRNSQPVSGLSGKLVTVGSDVLNNLMAFWAEEFQAAHPQAVIDFARGNNAANGLIYGVSDLGPMTREMNEREVAAFTKKYGYPPTRIIIAIDALAICVHPDNPVKSLTLAQVDSIFSSTRKRGGGAVATWGDLGLTEEWATKPIFRCGRNSASGTYGFFKERVLLKGDFDPTVKEWPGSNAVFMGVVGERGGVGYGPVGGLTAGVRAVPLGDGDKPAVEPTYEHATSGNYPLSRHLYIYINKKPGVRNELVSQFLTYVLSEAGQQIVIDEGFFPLSPAMVAEQRAVLEP